LNLPVDESTRHPRIDDTAPKPPPVPVVAVSHPNPALAPQSLHIVSNDTLVGAAVPTTLPQVYKKRPRPSYSVGAQPMSSVDMFSRPDVFVDRARTPIQMDLDFRPQTG